MEILTGYAVFSWIATWANPYWDLVFRGLTDLGYHTFYYLAIAPLFWIVDRRRASILFLLILASGLLNTAAKLIVHTPRPDPQLVRVLDLRPYHSGSYAFPSGHAQNAVVFWMYLASWVGRRWAYVAALAVIALICFSRLYLAVHFPIDIAGGLALGTALMLVLPRLLERWARHDFRLSATARTAAVAASIALAYTSRDLTLAMIGGSFLGFLVGAVWLPQRTITVANPTQAFVCLALGLLLLFALSTTFDAFPVNIRAILCARVAALWVIALWLYPQAWCRALAPARTRGVVE